MNAAGAAAGQIAEILVGADGAPRRRGSGYRVAPDTVLTAAHVIDGAASVRVRFDADLPTEWTTDVVSSWVDRHFDIAVLSIAPRTAEPPVVRPRFGRIGADRAAVLAVRSVGFPRFKLKRSDPPADPAGWYRDSHQADGVAPVLSNRRQGTLEVTVPAPAADPDPHASPWEGMSGAAVWADERIVGVITEHHRSDGLGRLAAARLDLALAGLDDERRAELHALLGLPDVLPDVVPPSTGARVRGAYQAQVRDIAPDELVGREAELDELVTFCAGDQPYAWWQAGPWAGKTALLSWFVLHPPAGVDPVSFFVTARLANQSDRDACATALIHQLAALTGEPADTPLLAGAQRGTLLRLLGDAASRAREAGRRVLLVIDGLDEDRSVGGSIAELLPRRPPPEVRVLVAGRPHPSLPNDVPCDHPLRRVTARRLDVSAHARDMERTAVQELNLLLAGDHLHRDVLGLITAAGGGLTLADLEHLTARSRFEIEPLLGGLFGRTVRSRGAPGPGRPDERVYLFAHETLRLTAEQRYGAALAAYRDRLHDWARTYQRKGWPADTPQYLMRHYSGMLASVEDQPRLVTCGTDRARHHRMRALTGGDALALGEIDVAQRLILAQPHPDLTSLVRLTAYRDHLTGHYSFIPDELPAAWARIGQFAHAEALVSSITDRGKRTKAWCALVKAVAAAGDRERAAQWADEAEAVIKQATDLFQVSALAELAESVAVGGDRERAARLVAEAEALTGPTTSPGAPTWRLAELAAAVVDGGDPALVARLVDEAETRVRKTVQPLERVGMSIRLVELVALSGDRERAARLTREAQTLVEQIAEPYHRQHSMRELVAAVVAGGDYERARALAGQISSPYERANALARLAAAAVPHGERAAWLLAEADVLARQVVDPQARTQVLPVLVEVVAACGDRGRAARWAGESQELIRRSGSPYRESVMGAIAAAVAAGGDHDLAEALAGQVTDRVPRAWALIRVATAVAARGDHDRAARLLVRAEEPDDQVGITDKFLVVHLVEALAVGGDHGRAALMADAAEALIRREADPGVRDLLLPELAAAVAVCGDGDRAEALVWQISHLDVRILVRLVALAAAGGDHGRVTRLTHLTESFTGTLPDLHQRVEVLAGLALAVAGYHDQPARLVAVAQALIGRITDRGQWEAALAGFVAAVAVTGDHHRAEALTFQITDPHHRISALTRLAEVAAAGGDRGRAVRLVGAAAALVGQIAESPPQRREWVLNLLVTAASAAGDHARAETLIGQLPDPRARADALARLAGSIAEAGRRSAPAPGPDHDPTPLMTRARHLLARALTSGSWGIAPGVLITPSWGEFVIGLALVDPTAAAALADDLRARWNLDALAAETARSRPRRDLTT
ncbi:trypsin-like peptidase domain-containing protein [Streptoalloteichus hindustanus]|uniref:Trypsin-like peptidase domain-containing protein n=1 Tax=Streptoalloteichus hindustanus TaxID=2017 RepID=A0A1M5IDN1_STRHI|nr:trypsin-like peptidase domain-containing protein [Streptoalloteichus hindustanus]SHG26468.1 Trypsin-like peptidase domain-containing protein [Streptoalloteichus hindustanus]